MSEPVTNVEIEDVLSSIRRLVSEDDRAPMRAEPAATAEKPVDRLVLTPALRVTPAIQEPQEASAPQEAPAPAHKAPEDVAASDTADSQSQSDEPVAQGESVDLQAGKDVPDVAEEPLAEDVGTAEGAADNEIDDTKADEPVFRHEEVRLEDRIVKLEAAVADRDDQWEPDGPSDDAYAGGPVEALAWEDVEGGRVADLPEADLDEVDISDAEIYGDPDEELEMAADEPELDDADLFGSSDTILDEETLREMVSEIVRQELQGSLGERITRNVRKLVRREIHRALTSQELD